LIEPERYFPLLGSMLDVPIKKFMSSSNQALKVDSNSSATMDSPFTY
jgi:hypothetical protein